MAVGALIGQEVFQQQKQSVTIVCLGEQGFETLLLLDHNNYNNNSQGHATTTHAAVRSDGRVYLGTNESFPLQQATQEEGNEDASMELDTSSTATHEQFTPEEEHMLAKASNSAERMALRVIFRYARIVASSSHESGCW